MAWQDSLLLAVALGVVAGASYAVLDLFVDDDRWVRGVPTLVAAVALINVVKAWRLFRIRRWIAAKPGLDKKINGIVGSAARMHGITTEQRALRRLRMPSGWQAFPNVPCGNGDVDLVLVAPDNTAYACEIKSWAGLRRRRTMFGLGRAVLVKRNGKEPDADPVEQTVRGARALAATGKYRAVTPILWIPNGSLWTFKHEGVKVVNGGGRRLKRAVGAGGLLW